MVFNLAIILVFAIIVFAAFLISLGAILLYLRSRDAQQRSAGKMGKIGKTEDELDESQASDIVATWNILNPP